MPEHLLGGPVTFHRPHNRKVWALWSALLLGVAVLGWMAWRLVQQMQAQTDAAPTENADPV